MSDPFIGEIRIFAGSYAPDGWLPCNGQRLSVSSPYTALFAVIGKFYGGDGSTYFNLPNLQGFAPLNQGQGAGLTNQVIGKAGGATTVTLNPSQMPSHTHTAAATNAKATSNDPTGRIWAKAAGVCLYATTNVSPVAMNGSALGPSGSQGAHNNIQPCLGVNFAIAWQGIFPVKP
ncbi:MAG: tail fiber protein [Geobacteraceae bacterium]|nr:tail fiber protein [Geobacteraceae bacterium]